MSVRVAVCAVLTATALTACASGDAGPREEVRSVASTLSGGLIGADRNLGATTRNATVGNQIGRNLGNDAREQAAAAEYRALEYGTPGTPVTWRHERYYGTITPGPYFASGSQSRCREFVHTLYINGQPESARNVACRNSEGVWSPQNS